MIQTMTMPAKGQTFTSWFTTESAGKTQEETFALLDRYNALRTIQLDHIAEEAKRKAKKVAGPEISIIKAFGYEEIVDCSIKDCGVPRFDATYKNFYYNYHKKEVPSGCYTAIFPPIFAEVSRFNSKVHMIGWIKYQLSRVPDRFYEAARNKIKKVLKDATFGREGFLARLENLKSTFIQPDTGYLNKIRGFRVFTKKGYRVRNVMAVRGPGGYAKIVRF